MGAGLEQPKGHVMTTIETKQFLAEIIPAQTAAERAIHNGDPDLRIKLWSHHDPVTLLGAKLTAIGWEEVEPSFRQVASWFSKSDTWEFEIIAAHASADLAYIVANEHDEAIVDGHPRSYTLRVTHVYRREHGQWRIVHRHADFPPDPDAPLCPKAASPD